MRIKIVEVWPIKNNIPKWWSDKLGREYEVRPFPYKATRGGTLNYCFCAECAQDRRGKTLYDMYEVVKGKKRGSIIPVVVCEILNESL